MGEPYVPPVTALEVAYREELRAGASWRSLVDREMNHAWKSFVIRMGALYVLYLAIRHFAFLFVSSPQMLWFVVGCVVLAGAALDLYVFKNRVAELGHAFVDLHQVEEPPTARAFFLQLLIVNAMPCVYALCAFLMTIPPESTRLG